MSRFEFSTVDFPESERVSAFQEIYASIANMDMESLGQAPFVEMVGQLLPGLGVYESTVSPHRSRRTHAHVSKDSNDDLALIVPINSSAVIIPENSEPLYCLPGEAILMPTDSVHEAVNQNTISIAFVVTPRSLITPRVSDLNSVLMKKITSTSAPELHLLVGYTRMLIQMKHDLSPQLASLVSAQVQDLLTLLCGARGEKSEIATNRGLRAARLNAVKSDITRHITDSDLSIGWVAQRQGISPQYIRALFHSENTTFADYVNRIRLEHIYRQLRNPLHIAESISTLAFNVGFNNLSWFNRAFKNQFGLTPSQVRESHFAGTP
jgi:AraC-like DNA-binding protein